MPAQDFFDGGGGGLAGNQNGVYFAGSIEIALERAERHEHCAHGSLLWTERKFGERLRREGFGSREADGAAGSVFSGMERFKRNRRRLFDTQENGIAGPASELLDERRGHGREGRKGRRGD